MRPRVATKYVLVICALVLVIICGGVYLSMNQGRIAVGEIEEERIATVAVGVIYPPPSPIEYRQVGILIPESEEQIVLPLMGRPILTRRDTWQYYAISNQHNNVRLPIIVRGREATNEYGVDKIYKGDRCIVVEGQRGKFRANIYDEINNNYVPTV